MAKRYSGQVTINLQYHDGDFHHPDGYYRASVSIPGSIYGRKAPLSCTVTVHPAPAGFGPGIGYDSSEAYDDVAASALSFAADDMRVIGDFGDWITGHASHTDSGWHISRRPMRAMR